eukprot:TRINITY_DN11528_c0_g1_i1.p1 TRINITY_DN11528_c0_g1~~TRINITY_DN11528_c0_g1_i1.p1  ORF type:complete len:175 (+),score=29.41 TRINITY_DN11528_c0_g1_i1:17-541(+)
MSRKEEKKGTVGEEVLSEYFFRSKLGYAYSIEEFTQLFPEDTQNELIERVHKLHQAERRRLIHSVKKNISKSHGGRKGVDIERYVNRGKEGVRQVSTHQNIDKVIIQLTDKQKELEDVKARLKISLQGMLNETSRLEKQLGVIGGMEKDKKQPDGGDLNDKIDQARKVMNSINF